MLKAEKIHRKVTPQYLPHMLTLNFWEFVIVASSSISCIVLIMLDDTRLLYIFQSLNLQEITQILDYCVLFQLENNCKDFVFPDRNELELVENKLMRRTRDAVSLNKARVIPQVPLSVNAPGEPGWDKEGDRCHEPGLQCLRLQHSMNGATWTVCHTGLVRP